MKKLIIPLAILLILALVISGCSSASTTTKPPTTTATSASPGTTTTTAPPAGKDKILVGMSRPLSGPQQIVGDSAFKPIYEYFVKQWNSEGGLNIGGKKMPIELKVYDNKSDIPTMTKQLEQLIVQDKVDFIWAPCSTADIFAAAPIANKYEKVLLTMEGGATSLEGMLPTMPYVFVSLSFADWYEVPVLAELLASKGVKTAYVTYIADLHGIEYSGVAGIELAKKGINIVANKSLPPEMKDFSLIIKDAKASGADAFLSFSYPDQVLGQTGQSIELGYNPKAMLFGPGANFGFYHTTFKSAVNGVMYWATWNRKVSPAFDDMYKKIYPPGVPEEANDWWGHALYFGAMEFWKQSVEKAGTLDNKKVREVMATSHFTTVLGDTFFTNGLMAKESHPGEVGQWQNDQPEVIGGNKTTAPFLYPKPEWPAPPK
jgi:branched-chain amino acid transport system substrate-binding protein